MGGPHLTSRQVSKAMTEWHSPNAYPFTEGVRIWWVWVIKVCPATSRSHLPQCQWQCLMQTGPFTLRPCPYSPHQMLRHPRGLLVPLLSLNGRSWDSQNTPSAS